MRRLTPAVLFGLVLACGSVPTTHYYVLAPPTAGETDSPLPLGEGPEVRAAEGVRLGVETFVVDPPYDQDRLVYRVGRESAEVGFYNHHRWSAPPGRLVAAALAAGLRGTPGIATVEPARVTGDYSHVLAGRVVAIEEVDLPGKQLARIQLDLKLVDAEDDSVLWSRFVTVEEEGRAEEAGDVMRQVQAAFAKVVGTVRGELEAVFGRP